MARVPLGPWKPSTEKEDLALTDFENDETLQREVMKDAIDLVESIDQPTTYLIGDKAEKIDPKVVKGLMKAKKVK